MSEPETVYPVWTSASPTTYICDTCGYKETPIADIGWYCQVCHREWLLKKFPMRKDHRNE